MRIAVLFHAHHLRDEVENDYVVGVLANLWREQGHTVRFLIGCRERWDADVVMLHVDLSCVPRQYVTFARTFPVVLNDRIVDIRKSRISKNLVVKGAAYNGPVIVKTDLNSSGIPERKLLERGRWRQFQRWALPWRSASTSIEYVKQYGIYDRLTDVPTDVLERPGAIVEKFLPEVEGDRFFTRRCFVLGDRSISYRMGDTTPLVEGGTSFEWIDESPEVLAYCREVGLDYGVVDYTVHEGHVAVLDVNKTVGIGRILSQSARDDYDRILGHLAPGILARSRVSVDPRATRGGAA